jgi:hypothetical protein
VGVTAVVEGVTGGLVGVTAVVEGVTGGVTDVVVVVGMVSVPSSSPPQAMAKGRASKLSEREKERESCMAASLVSTQRPRAEETETDRSRLSRL